MRIGTTAAAILLLAACNRERDETDRNAATEAPPALEANGTAAAPAPAPKSGPERATGWRLEAGAGAATLALVPTSGRNAALRIICPAKGNAVIVNVPAFSPIGSEERLSFGSGSNVAAFVADVRGDRERGGVTGIGAVKAELADLLGGPVSASYGAQTSGPHAAPPADVARAFVAACRASPEAPATPPPPPTTDTAAGTGGPCMVQDGTRLSVAPRRAIGTEPFWNARIEGRCVTYSHPEDQAGTRIWTRYAKNRGVESWTGALAGRVFALRIRPAPGCSDGMSDRRYPYVAELEVAGEKRSGCAAQL